MARFWSDFKVATMQGILRITMTSRRLSGWNRPVIDLEPRYEGHAVNRNVANGYFDSYDVRQAFYWSILAAVPATRTATMLYGHLTAKTTLSDSRARSSQLV
jgi:hypothetical protein